MDVYFSSKETDRQEVPGKAILCGGAYLYWFSGKGRCVALSMSEAGLLLGTELVIYLFKLLTKLPSFECNLARQVGYNMVYDLI